MPVPKRKRSRARRDSRFANKGLKAKAFHFCANCQDSLMPHQVCRTCGYYKGVKIMQTKLDRKLKRVEIKQTRAASKQARVAKEQPTENNTASE